MTVPKWTYEFLATLSHDRDNQRITFRLGNADRVLAYAGLCRAFGWADSRNYRGRPYRQFSKYEADILWGNITHLGTVPPSGKIAMIPHPALRLIYRVIGQCVFGHGEPNNITNLELGTLASFIPNENGNPNWPELFAVSCMACQGSINRSIGMGGMITLIAQHFNIPETEDLLTLTAGCLFSRPPIHAPQAACV